MADLYRVTGRMKASVVKVNLEPRPNMYTKLYIGVGNDDMKNNVTIVLTKEEAEIVVFNLLEKLKLEKS